MASPILLGVEIGGTKLQLGLGTGDGSLAALSRLRIQPGDGARGILRQILGEFPGLLKRSGLDEGRPAAIGIGFGGPVDSGRGVVIRSHQVDGWGGFDLAGWARAELGISRVAVENDADTAGLGEARFGAGAGLSPIFYVTIGSGIGGGLIVDGRIYRGSGVGAAEIGHLWVGGGEKGLRRLEDVASGWSIGSTASNLLGRDAANPSQTDAESVVARARLGDPSASSILDRAARSVGEALGHVVTLLAPRRIILGGGVSLIEDSLWLDPIRTVVQERAFPPFRDTYDIVTASLGQDVVIHGALALASDLVGGRERADTPDG